MKLSKTLLVLTTMLLLNVNLKADSYYSSVGLGIPHYFVSAQASGMGGAGMAVQQYLSLNEMNPAAVNLKGFTMISAAFQAEIVDHTVGDDKEQTRQGRASGFRFVVPLKKNRVVLITGLKPLTKSSMSVEFERQYDDYLMQRRVTTSGGVHAASIGLKYAIKSWLHLGGVFNFNFGSFNEKWATSFEDDTFLDAKDDLNSHLWGTGAELGVLVMPHPLVSLSGVVRTPSKMNIETTITPGSGIALEPLNQKADYPIAFGLGSAVDLTKLLFAADFYFQNWENYRLDGQSSSNQTNFIRFSSGVEYIDSKDFLTRYHRRIAYRVGGSWAKLPFSDENGEQVQEVLGTIGLGFPFNRNLGRIDLSLEAGKRFSNDTAIYSERIMRISASVTSAERWFQRVF